jgi:hypothetical protein
MVNYSRIVYKHIRDTVGHTLASTSAGSVDSKTINSTSLGAFTGTVFGRNFDVTVKCTTGAIYVAPYSTVPVSAANGYQLEEGDEQTFKVKTALQIVGGSTTAGYCAIVWADYVG